MLSQAELNKKYLALGAEFKKLVEIDYRYLYRDVSEPRRYGLIQPIKWEYGTNGLHILTWDVAEDNWRRFAVANIEQVTLTDKDWTNQDLEPELI